MQLDKNMTEKCQTSSEELNPNKWGQSAGHYGSRPILWRLGSRSCRNKILFAEGGIVAEVER
eukprot:4234533-Ditylum_brightwellii.AAC.1